MVIKNFWKDVYGNKERTYYNQYGKVFRINPKKLFKKAVIFDTVVPLTFFIPFILAGIVYLVTKGKEFMIDDWRYEE